MQGGKAKRHSGYAHRRDHVRRVAQCDLGQGLSVLVHLSEFATHLSQVEKRATQQCQRLLPLWELPDFVHCQGTGVEDELAEIDACTSSGSRVDDPMSKH
jgi:hypothetical protein